MCAMAISHRYLYSRTKQDIVKSTRTGISHNKCLFERHVAFSKRRVPAGVKYQLCGI